MYPGIPMLLTAIFFTIVAAFSIFATVRANNLYLPIGLFTRVLTIGLPIANGLAIYVTSGRTSKKLLTPRLRALLPTALSPTLTVLFMLDAVLVTLASASLSPENLECAIERRWRFFFQTHNQNAIRSIQNALECCGLRTPVDQAWPFVPATACKESTGRTIACEPGWEGAERGALTSMIIVGVAIMLAKIALLVVMRTQPKWFGTEQRQANDHRVRGMITGADAEEEEAIGRERYLDEPEEDLGEIVEGNREGQDTVMASG